MTERNKSVAPGLDPNTRLTVDDSFRFGCGPHVPCFTECCGKLELLLTPYDVLRLKTRLNASSADFLDMYTTTRWRTPHGFPDMVMRMEPAPDKRCPFVTDRG